jgi:membrane protein DedA with SNARE-associated domain
MRCIGKTPDLARKLIEKTGARTSDHEKVVLFENWGWYASIYLWMLFTGNGIPPVPEEAGILYAAGVTSLHPGVHWWLAWPVTSFGIVSADVVLYGIGRLWGQRLFQTRWVKWLLHPERRQ